MIWCFCATKRSTMLAGLFIAAFVIESTLGARGFSDFAASDLLRHSKTSGRRRQIEEKFVLRPSLESVQRPRPVEPRLKINFERPKNSNINEAQLEVQKYDENGNRLEGSAGRHLISKHSTAVKSSYAEPSQVTLPPAGQQKPVMPLRRSVIVKNPSLSAPIRPNRTPGVDTIATRRVADRGPQTINDNEEYYFGENDWHQAKDTSYLNPTYVEYPNQHEPPQEQRNIQAAVESGADKYDDINSKNGIYQNEERISFQIHGHDGPQSYRYGYDTGHGYNRQFRYEEKDGNGYLKGRYGFFDKNGELKVVNYSADPYDGFHAEGAEIS